MKRSSKADRQDAAVADGRMADSSDGVTEFWASTPGFPRRHRDVFTGPEALIYLGCPDGTERTLESLRSTHGLPCFRVGQATCYHRLHLDALVARLAGIDVSRRK